MPFTYDKLPEGGPLRQGELLGNVVVHEAEHPPVELPKETDIVVRSTRHPYVVVVSQDCDLEWDFKARYPEAEFPEQYHPAENIQNPHILVPQVLVCDAYVEGEVRGKEGRIGNSAAWKLVKGNRDSRYHHLDSASIGDDHEEQIPDLFLDFKKTMAIPTDLVYEGIEDGAINRIAKVPAPYVHALAQRYFSYHGRVGLPD